MAHLTLVYGDDTGDTHLTDIQLLPGGGAGGLAYRELPDVPVTTMTVTDMLERRPTRDLHPPPRRQLVVILRGEIEIATTSGDRQRLGVGDCVLVDDLDSKGHTFEDVGDEPLLTVQVGIASNWPVRGIAGRDASGAQPASQTETG
ncbi:MAG: hypothetical protein J2P57_01900 [Acidimicrobiaceae bacterium]|nr:hypothetical protein [Acidimicrobiaceae bacterium]